MKLTVVLCITLLSVCAADPGWTDWFSKAGNWISGAIDDTGKWLVKAKDDTVAWVEGAVEDTKAFFGDIWAKIMEFYNTYIKPVINDIVEIFNAVKEAGEFVMEKIRAGFEKEDRLEVRKKVTQVFTLIASKADKYFYEALGGVEKFINAKVEDLAYLTVKIASFYTKEISDDCSKNINTDIENYKNAFKPKLQNCTAHAKKELETAYKFIKDVVLGVPGTVMDVIEVISTCYEAIRDKGGNGCIVDVGAAIISAGTSVIMDVISMKVLIIKAVKKAASSSTCVVNAAKSLKKEKKSLSGHLKDCGMEAAIDYLM